MQGDFSRTTFDPADGYRSVLLQQGRVLLDADWNEQAAITAHHDEVRALDAVGRHGGPAPSSGSPGPFAIVDADGSVPRDTAWADLRVTPGTYHVDGVLAESSLPAPRVGWPLVDQPHLPRAGTDDGLPQPGGAAGTRYALYLDVWTRHVTADEDPSLLETALGGPDTATRARTVWQVRTALLESEADLCSDLQPAGTFGRTPRRMAAGLEPPEIGADPCQITGTGGYEGLENQLYRVQVHQGASGTSAGSFLWSRDNGSVVARLVALRPGDGAGTATLELDRVGRDPELTIAAGQLVEVSSLDRELRGLPGFLALTGTPVGVDLPVTWAAVSAPATLAEVGRAPVVRRWDGGPEPVRSEATPLEAGITVRFPGGGQARTGDYWTIPARSVRLAYGVTQLSGTIEWPPGGTGPVERPPEGIAHHTAPLAVVRRTAAGWTRESDCRRLFPALTGLVTLDLVGGDGQESVPGTALPEPVRVVVRNGSLPVAGAWLAADSGTGHVSIDEPDEQSPARLPDPPGSGVPLVTDSAGVAEVRWLLDPGGATTQSLTIRRLDDHRRPVDVPVVVTGRLSVAREVAWEPVCDEFARTPTVQDALSQLATTAELRLLGGDGQAVQHPDTTVPVPVRVGVDSPCGPVRGAVVGVLAGDDASGLVLEARPGEPTPPTLSGLPDAKAKITVRTGPDGVAAVWWQPVFGKDRAAVLELGHAESGSAAVRVSARLDPPGDRRPGVHITELRFLTDRPFVNDADVGPDDLAKGIRVSLDGPVDRETVRGKPVARVELDLPWPVGGEDNAVWSRLPVGTRTVTLTATIDYDGGLLWHPGDRTRGWVGESLVGTLAQFGFEGVHGRFVVEGWAIAAEDDPLQHVNGHANAVSRGGRTRFALPTDDEVAGGTFVQWFRLTRDPQRPGLVKVPSVTGHFERVARRELETAGLVVAEVRAEDAPGVRKGMAVRTEPPEGKEVEEGTAVVLFLSTGRG